MKGWDEMGCKVGAENSWGVPGFGKPQFCSVWSSCPMVIHGLCSKDGRREGDAESPKTTAWHKLLRELHHSRHRDSIPKGALTAPCLSDSRKWGSEAHLWLPNPLLIRSQKLKGTERQKVMLKKQGVGEGDK